MQTPLPLHFTSSFNRLNFRGAFFVILSLSKYYKKAEMIPANLHRIMPAKGEMPTPPPYVEGLSKRLNSLPDLQLNFL